jgi:murein DD-endopeptidase MepM/ murein hydrolase activator NlpD
MKPSTFVTAVGLGVALGLAACSHAPDDPTLDDGRHLTQAFWAGHTQELWDRFTEPMKQAIGSPDALDAFAREGHAELGDETAVTDEHVEDTAGLHVYLRTSTFAYVGTPYRISLSFDAAAAIAGLFIEAAGPPALAPTTRADYQTHAQMHLPFGGAWTVAWGGRTLADNYHAAYHDQRFAYDILMMQAGTTHAGDGTHNSDYFAYGQAILAPAAGTVAVVVDGVAENVPGQMDPAHAAGNHVVIDLGDGEYVFLAHMIPGSLMVAVGDHVDVGQPIGRCGNSGNSSEPHLHVHLQTTPRLHDGEGLPAQFLDYTADGVVVARGEPTRGQVIESR